jgi:hypothetical protein
MNIPEDDRPIAYLRIGMKHHGAVKQIATWLRDQADYIEAHETECSKYLTLRLFASEGKYIQQHIQIPDGSSKLIKKHGPR